MLRINVLNEPGISRLVLEGKLSLQWVDEAERVWTSLRVTNNGATILVDLYAVSFVDPAGHGLLAAMHSAGAELVGSGVLISALIAEIKAQNSIMRARSCAIAFDGTEVKHDC